MSMLPRPTYRDVLRASRRISPHVVRTQLRHYPNLSRMLGFEVYVKHENHQITGAFKVRGGINLVSQLSQEEKGRGVVTASTGNHGQSIAYASRLYGVRAVVCVPNEANPDKVEAIRGYGAEIVEEGRGFNEARLNAERLAREEGFRYVHSGDEPHLIAGVGTVGLEIIEDLPDVDVVIIPVGGGSGAAGIGTVVKAVSSQIQVIGVQAERAQSVYLSWRRGEIVPTDSADTMADGLANSRAFQLPLDIMSDVVDDFVIVTEEEMMDAIWLYVEKAHTIAEGAGAASLAAAIKIRDRLKGKRVVLELSGGNITAQMLRNILCKRR
jgi:threonine dehydratase